jgi:uncharacterized HAD superfamily protein
MNHFCIDIDNTVAQSDAVMRRVIADFTEGRVELDYEGIVTFNYYECRDLRGNQITREEWNQVHELYSDPKYLMSIAPMSGAVEGLRRLAERGIVHLATSRLPKARKTTLEWLEHHSFPPHDLHFLRPGEKHAVLKGFAAAVEDDYDQAAAFAYVSETPCFLIRHPWNRSRYQIPRVQWVEGWPDLTERLLALASGPNHPVP